MSLFFNNSQKNLDSKVKGTNKSFFVFADRNTVLKNIPTKSKILEIGVYQGANAEFLLNHTDLSELHLVDTWALKSFQEMLDNKGDFQVGMPMKISVVNKMKEQLMLLCKEYRGEDNPSVAFEFVYKSVLEKFKDKKNVHIYRQKSVDAVTSFKSDFFDVIYVDGDHSFNAVLNDLLLYESKLKSGGIFIGNDYLLSENDDFFHYGVLSAVNQFCKTRNFNLLLVTYGEYADFVLYKNFSPFVNKFLQNLIDSELPMISMDGGNLFNYKNSYYLKSNGTKFFIPTI
ncbi:class I SAM-dependent methyltransferase [Pelagibacterales bacterium SAG-MED03]|nr:class I SAM-dependent methyltransferase [Pelagibacterales bacterium SAG-MED03]